MNSPNYTGIISELETNGIILDLDGYVKNFFTPMKEKFTKDSQFLCKKFGVSGSLLARDTIKEVLRQRNILRVMDPFEELQKKRYKNPDLSAWYNTAQLERKLSMLDPKKLREKMDEQSRIHGTWRIAEETTGRLVCSNPPLQNIPREARTYFVPAVGNVFVTVDYSTIELRVLAKLCGDPDLIADLAPGKDIHRRTAAIILGKKPEKISDNERQVGKTVNFLISYGGSAEGMSRMIGEKNVIFYSVADAERMMYRFFDTYPLVYGYQQRISKGLLPSCSIGGKVFKDLSETRMLNYPVQASAAEGFLNALSTLISNKPKNYKLVMAIHDSMSLEVPEKDREAATEFLKTTAETVMGEYLDPVPVFAEVKNAI